MLSMTRGTLRLLKNLRAVRGACQRPKSSRGGRMSNMLLNEGMERDKQRLLLPRSFRELVVRTTPREGGGTILKRTRSFPIAVFLRSRRENSRAGLQVPRNRGRLT